MFFLFVVSDSPVWLLATEYFSDSNSEENTLVAPEKCVSCWVVPGVPRRLLRKFNLSSKMLASVITVNLLNYNSMVATINGSKITILGWINPEIHMALPVGWMNSSSSIGIFSILISCRNSSQVYVEEWECFSWTRWNLSRWCVCLVIGVKKSAHHDSKSLRLLDVFPNIYGEESVNRAVVV